MITHHICLNHETWSNVYKVELPFALQLGFFVDVDLFLDRGLCLYSDNNNETDDIIGMIRSQSNYCCVEEICIEKDGVISVELFLQKDTFGEFNEDGIAS